MTQKNNRLKDYAKYSSLAFQMMIIIFGGTFGGLKLDQYLENKFPIFTLSLSLIAVFTALYIALKDFIKRK
ncbi:MAG: AtpZ/AtpI family protein [Bacteroidales bacterium]|jgi:hypothetical protein|nr:AtpZ/AtpI family protein [Bacteroidales bacterium]